MGDRLEEMPLFPMNTVLFPYAKLQIHVFEDRYRELVHYCMRNDQPFGVVLIRGGEDPQGLVEHYMVGTAVRIVSVHTFDDGKMDVIVHGERRFRVRRLDETKSFLSGWVENVSELEIEDMDRADNLVMTSKDYVQAYIENKIQTYDVKVKLPPDPTVASFVIADFLQVENIEKQRLLETTDTIERLSDMIMILEQHMLESNTSPYHRITRQHMEEWISPN